jgi:hypothetical protein
MPVMMPAAGGAPEATAIPMQRGRATKKTTTEAKASWRRSTQRLEDGGIPCPIVMVMGIT